MSQSPITNLTSLAITGTDDANNLGFYVPLMTTAQRDAISTSLLRNGALICNSTTGFFNVYQGSAWKALSATADPEGNLVALSHATAAVPTTPINGMIYYDTTTNQYTAYLNGAWIALYASTNLAGNMVVKIFANTGALPTGVNGMIAYQTDIARFKGYNSAWVPFPVSTNVQGYTTIATGAGAPTVTAPYSTQAHTVGTLYYNTAVPALYVCNIAGTPGTWLSVVVA